MHIFKSLLKGCSLPPHLIKNLSFKQIFRNYAAEKAIKALTFEWFPLQIGLQLSIFNH